MKQSGAQSRSRAASAREILARVGSEEELAAVAVMLERQFTETIQLDGEEVEVWLRFPGSHRCTPKLARNVGSGFLVAAGQGGVLVTAGHVARQMDREARIVFAGRTGRRTSLRLADFVAMKGGAPAWVFARRADTAVVRLRLVPSALAGHFLAFELLARERTPPGGALELSVVGFPLGLASERKFAPIVKHLHAASGVLSFRGEEMNEPGEFFLLDQPSTGGYSGAPVFVVPRSREASAEATAARCVGLISQTISDDTAGQFAAVVPSAAIRRVIRKALRA